MFIILTVNGYDRSLVFVKSKILTRSKYELFHMEQLYRFSVGVFAATFGEEKNRRRCGSQDFVLLSLPGETHTKTQRHKGDGVWHISLFKKRSHGFLAAPQFVFI